MYRWTRIHTAEVAGSNPTSPTNKYLQTKEKLKSLVFGSVSETDLRGRVISEMEVEGGLRLVDLTGPGAARIGATGAISTDPHELARPWSRTIYEHPSSPQVIYYRLKHDLDRKGVAIFEREGIRSSTRAEGRGTLMGPGNARLLGEILELYGFGLVPS